MNLIYMFYKIINLKTNETYPLCSKREVKKYQKIVIFRLH